MRSGLESRPFARRLGWLAGSLLVIAGNAATAGEIVVQGHVLDVPPITSSRQVAETARDCHPPPPPRHDDLAELLAWDLKITCPTIYRSEETITGYQVRYEWDDRVYSRVMHEPPGDTVTLRVTVN